MRASILNRAIRTALTSSLLLGGFSSAAFADLSTTGFTPGDLVISTVSGTTLDSASAITLQEFSLGAGGASAAYVDSLTLPQTGSGNNSAISGEYGSASEGILQQSVNGAYLTMMGYGVNAATFNSYTNAATSPYGALALGQTTSLVGGASTTVARVAALIGSDGSVDTSTALTGVFNTNNPRSVATVDGSSFYVSGQGVSGDSTQGVFYATRGATTATAIDTSTDTRVAEIINNGSRNTLYVSRDYNPPGGAAQNFTNVSTLTNSSGDLPTASTGLVTTHITPDTNSSKGNNGSINLTAATENGVNNARVGSFVYLSPEQYFMASSTVMYVADSGQPKNGSANAAALGEGGLQKWELVNGTWTLEYDLVAGLNLVNNANANSNTPTAPGVTGLFGLTAEVVTVNGQQVVELFATSYGLNELSQSYLYEITDTLSNTTITQAAGETFTTLVTAANGESIRGVAFAPTVASSVAAVPLPPSMLLMLTGLSLTGIFSHRRKRA